MKGGWNTRSLRVEEKLLSKHEYNNGIQTTQFFLMTSPQAQNHSTTVSRAEDGTMITHLSTHNRLAELQVGPGAMTSKTRVIGKEALVFLTTNEKVTIRARNARSSLLSQGFFAGTNISLDGDASLCYGPTTQECTLATLEVGARCGVPHGGK